MDRHVFVSHASEDKDSLVRPMVNALSEAGVRVWYDEHDIRLGDSLRAAIDEGLRNASFGILVLSEAFVRKQWTSMELDGLLANSRRVPKLLPVWHNISIDDVRRYSPMLAGLRAVDSSVGLHGIVTAVVDRLEFDRPYRQISGEHRVHLHDKRGSNASVLLARTVQVGSDPVSEIWARVPASKKYSVETVTPGKLDRLEPDVEQLRAVVAHEPPMPPGQVFTQHWHLRAQREYIDPVNSAGLRSALNYEEFTLSVQSDHPGSITDVKAHRVDGLERVELSNLTCDSSETLWEVVLNRPDQGVEYAITWRRN